jgi:hypothetical protein
MSGAQAPAAQQQKAVALAGADPSGPSVQAAAAGVPIPEDAWEYQVRKSLNDAAFQNLQFQGVCHHMPVCKGGCKTAGFMVRGCVRGGRGGGVRPAAAPARRRGVPRQDRTTY